MKGKEGWRASTSSVSTDARREEVAPSLTHWMTKDDVGIAAQHPTMPPNVIDLAKEKGHRGQKLKEKESK